MNFLGFLWKWKAVKENGNAFEEYKKAFAKSSKASQKVERSRGKQKAEGKSARVRELASMSGHETRSKGSLPLCQDMKPEPTQTRAQMRLHLRNNCVQYVGADTVLLAYRTK